MFKQFDEIQEFGVQRLETVTTATVSATRGLQAIADEAAEYRKRTLDNGYAFAGKLLRVKKPTEFADLQSAFVKSAYEDYLSAAKKISDLYSGLAKQTYQDLTRDLFKGMPSTLSTIMPLTTPKGSKQD